MATKSKIDREKDYYPRLYRRYRNYRDVREQIMLLLKCPEEVIKDILSYWVIQAERSDVTYDKDNKEYWSHFTEEYGDLDEEGRELYTVVDHAVANIIYSDFLRDSLPTKYPDRTKLPPDVKTFEDLIQVLCKVNPHWLIELAAFSTAGGDFAHCFPNNTFDYNINTEEYNQIKEYLTKLFG